VTGALPPTATVRRPDTHRLIPSAYSRTGSVLAEIAEDEAHLRDLFELDLATNDRVLAENGRLPGIGPEELIFGVPYFRIVNAAFTHAHPMGSRFNGPERGAWYAGFELRTSQAEVAFHKTAEYAEIGRFEDRVTYDDYLADVSAQLHDLRHDERFAACLAADSYLASQELAERLLDAGSIGVVYPSVRRRGGTCLAVFRPAVVSHVRLGATYAFEWRGDPVPRIDVVAREA
jgi:hypothetical protein